LFNSAVSMATIDLSIYLQETNIKNNELYKLIQSEMGKYVIFQWSTVSSYYL
jgi:hypothetical protein